MEKELCGWDDVERPLKIFKVITLGLSMSVGETKQLSTISVLHKHFIYHGDLKSKLKYVFLDRSLCILRPSTLLKSIDERKAKYDLIGFGDFFSQFSYGQSNELTDFVDEFGKYSIEV